MMTPKINKSTDICVEIIVNSQHTEIQTYEGEEPLRLGKNNLPTLRIRKAINSSDYLKVGDDRFREAVEMVLDAMINNIKTNKEFYLSGE